MHPESPQRLGDFELLRELGRGGMGIVYEARQVSLSRKVALKVLSGGLGLTSKAIQRFRREAEAAAKLHHTNIVPIYATGEEDGTHFYAMELIDGFSLDHVIRKMRDGAALNPGEAAKAVPEGPATVDLGATGPYTPETTPNSAAASATSSSLGSGSQYFDTIARQIAEVADALEYAHKDGVIHRDIKPSNLLVSLAGRFSLNDFGLARMLEQPGMTMTGEFVGTPAYMSPEQITAGRAPLNHRTDIYSLGATLYELLTLQRPFTGERRDEVIAQIMHKEPKAPRKVNAKVPVDLETICLKAMEKDPDRRYQTAGELAEDLRRYVNRFAISAKRAGVVERTMKWIRRHPAVAVSLAIFVIAVLAVSGFAYRAYQSEQQRLSEREQARKQLLDEKIRNAYLVATSGDLKKTEEAIREIEKLGASPGQVRLLRGMVAYFRSDAKEAISELEQAVALLPDSVMARALLAVSYLDYNQTEKGEQTMHEMERLAPSSAEDYLFRGNAYEFNDPGQGLADLNEGIQERDSPLGRALRAISLSNRAAEKADRAYVEKALVDANAARAMLPDNPLALYSSLYARTVAASIYGEAKLPEQRMAMLKEATLDAQALQPFIAFPNAATNLWIFYKSIGDKDKAVDVARRSLAASKSPTAASMCAFDLYEQRRDTEALQCLDQLGGQNDFLGDVMRALVIAELKGQHPALQEYKTIAQKYQQGAFEMRFCGHLLLILGKKDMAITNYKAFTTFPGLKSEDSKEFYKAIGHFGRGTSTAEEYLNKAGASRFWQSMAHLDIGLTCLAAGDRTGARKHLQMAANTRTYWFYESFWSQMFLSRMDADPTWPPWIQPKKIQ
jgi:serine/threonine protein kinase